MKQIEVAKKYLAQKEMPGNVFVESTPLGRLIKKAGQKDGEAWCAYFVEGVFVEAYPERAEQFSRLFSASAVKTFDNFKNAKFTTGRKPKVGDIVIWQRYKDGKATWQGHAGLVSQIINENTFKSIEGNTNSAGSREGDSVQEKTRTMSVLSTGLNVLGFITI
jgi:hypothetical protein